jgi:hypothetical protein
MMRLTKSFVENRFYRRVSPGQFAEIPKAETGEGPSIDAQVKAWAEATGNIIIHPGQLGMHTSWHGDQNDPYQIKCLTFGQIVLYQEADNERRAIQHPDPDGVDIGANPAPTGTVDPRAWGSAGSTTDRSGAASSG